MDPAGDQRLSRLQLGGFAVHGRIYGPSPAVSISDSIFSIHQLSPLDVLVNRGAAPLSPFKGRVYCLCIPVNDTK